MAKTTKWHVHKFGGTSLANAERIRTAAQIVIRESGNNKAIVVSAMSGVTNKLIQLVDDALYHKGDYKAGVEHIRKLHVDTFRELVPHQENHPFHQALGQDLADISDVLRGVWVAQSATPSIYELVSGYGEIWSAQMMCAYLQTQSPVDWLDARKVLVIQHGETGVIVNWAESEKRFQSWLQKREAGLRYTVITGYVASTPQGVPTTLQRNGSDHSASIFGNLLDAELVTIWTDVDGVMSADPRKVPDAFVLDEMSYAEAMELAYFGAKILHPNTMAPAVAKGIPLSIRNSFHPEAPGTLIVREPSSRSKHIAEGRPSPSVKGFATADNMALISVEGSGMLGVPGVAQRLFGALKEAGISVILISQASSEQSICFAVQSQHGHRAKEIVEKAFYFEMNHQQIQRVNILEPCTILAAVGESMVERPGVSARFFAALSRAGVNIRAIAQGSSERNISAVIDQKDSERALRAVHSGFYLSDQTLSVGLIGPGLIGSTFLKQLEQQIELLKARFKVDIRLRGILDSKKMHLADKSIDLKNWRELLSEKGQPSDLQIFASHIKADHLPHAVILDCTSSQAIADLYPTWLKNGLHIITPNKKAGSGPIEQYHEIKRLKSQYNVHYLYETTVGAGLPIINTLHDLVQTGDQIEKIEGVFSGTLSFLFNEFKGKKSFSEIVKEAKQKGYTEPDPRDDLSGMDVARKVVILAREMGLSLEVEDIQLESLVPEALRNVKSVDEFLTELGQYDNEMNKKLESARSQGGVLRYVGIIEPAKEKSQVSARVELRTYPQEHAFAGLQGSDNIIAFTTSRYLHQALIIRGPGAGPEVTAGGVFADLLRLTANLGATL